MTRRTGLVMTVVSAAALVVGLAGCKKDSVTATNESAASVAEKVAKSDIKPRPGRWEGSVKIDDMKMPNMPPQAKEMLNQRLGKAQTFATCLTPEQAAKPDASFFQQTAAGCTYEHFTMAGGKVDAKVTCTRGAQKQTMVMNGSYSPDNYAITVDTSGEVQPGMPVTMKMSIASKRVGDCTGKEG